MNGLYVEFILFVVCIILSFVGDWRDGEGPAFLLSESFCGLIYGRHYSTLGGLWSTLVCCLVRRRDSKKGSVNFTSVAVCRKC